MKECSTPKQQIEKEAGIFLSNNWEKDLYEYIDGLTNTNFEKLVYLLYRIDVSEAKIKSLLNNKHNTNVSHLIAEAIVERLLEKKITREHYRQQTNNTCSEERW